MGRKTKGFKTDKVVVNIPDLCRLDPAGTTPDKLETLLTEILRIPKAQSTYKPIRRLCNMPPTVRMAVNIKTVFDIMCSGTIVDTLRAVLTDDEYQILCTIDQSGMSLESRRIAHTLMDINARIKAVQVFGPQMRHYSTQKSHKLIQRLLDNQ